MRISSNTSRRQRARSQSSVVCVPVQRCRRVRHGDGDGARDDGQSAIVATSRGFGGMPAADQRAARQLSSAALITCATPSRVRDGRRSAPPAGDPGDGTPARITSSVPCGLARRTASTRATVVVEDTRPSSHAVDFAMSSAAGEPALQVGVTNPLAEFRVPFPRRAGGVNGSGVLSPTLARTCRASALRYERAAVSIDQQLRDLGRVSNRSTHR